MKIFLASVFAILLFSGMKLQDVNVYTIVSTPHQDTLISGKGNCNFVQVMINGKPDSANWCIVSVTNAFVAPDFYKGNFLKYIVTVDSSNVKSAVLVASRNGKVVAHKIFVVK